MRINNILKASSLVVSSVLLFIGCTSNNSGKSGSSKPETLTVTIQGMKFVPDTLKANVGDTIVFINKDIVAHNVTQKDSAWHSPDIQTDSSWKMVMKEDVNYFCSIHPVMTGVLLKK